MRAWQWAGLLPQAAISADPQLGLSVCLFTPAPTAASLSYFSLEARQGEPRCDRISPMVPPYDF
jgi:hypothetical protein